MTDLPRPKNLTLHVALASFTLFILPMALFLHRFPVDAPFYFLAQDAFYYLSIALHSAHTPFFTLDGLHPTNGFHPLWECLDFTLAKLPFFRLNGPAILPRLFAVDLTLVGLAVSLLAAYIYRLTRRPWLSILAVCPGPLWLLVGIGAPACLNFWASVNGMETGLELLFFSLTSSPLRHQVSLRPTPPGRRNQPSAASSSPASTTSSTSSPSSPSPPSKRPPRSASAGSSPSLSRCS